jgi:hypothetical protein
MPIDATDRRVSDERLNTWLEMVRAARSETDREAALNCYFATVLPEVIDGLDLHAQHHELRGEKFHTLISLMGFSPETTVICAAVVRPQRLFVIYGAADNEEERRKVQLSFRIAHQFLTTHGILDAAQIHHQEINPIDPIEIYAAIRTAIDQTPAINDSTSALVDITGGKKVMSATAGQSAWEARLPLCYVEGEYEPTLRRPWPGTEIVMKLQNPSQQEQLQMRIDALNLYSNRNYPLAAEAFDTCEANRTENRLDVFASALCRAYVRWTDLDLPRLKYDVEFARKRLDEPRLIRLFGDRRQAREPLFQRLDALMRVSDAEPLAMIASYQELAHLYQSDAFQRFDFACLLLYRAMEATVEFGLRQRAGSKFNLRRLLEKELPVRAGWV